MLQRRRSHSAELERVHPSPTEARRHVHVFIHEDVRSDSLTSSASLWIHLSLKKTMKSMFPDKKQTKLIKHGTGVIAGCGTCGNREAALKNRHIFITFTWDVCTCRNTEFTRDIPRNTSHESRQSVRCVRKLLRMTSNPNLVGPSCSTFSYMLPSNAHSRTSDVLRAKIYLWSNIRYVANWICSSGNVNLRSKEQDAESVVRLAVRQFYNQ